MTKSRLRRIARHAFGASMKPSPILSLLLAPAAPAVADTLLIQRVKAAGQENLPHRGASMASVEADFGAPTQKHAAIGGGSANTPPITRWDYPEFSVYFEN